VFPDEKAAVGHEVDAAVGAIIDAAVPKRMAARMSP